MVHTAAGDQTQTLAWQNSLSVGFGAEYFVTRMVPVRAGYLLTTSATPEDRPGPFFPTPGLLHSVHAGAGVRLPAFDLDLGGFYSWGSHESSTTEPPIPPGEYSMNVTVVSASVTYHQ